MSNVVRFPGRKDTAQPIPREKFERLAELSLDVVDLIVSILNDQDGDPDAEDADPDLEEGGDAEPSLGAPEGHENQVVWLRGTTRDLEIDRQPERGDLPQLAGEPDLQVDSTACT